MWYFNSTGRFLPHGSPAALWGAWSAYIEVADDQLAARQIDRFENGSVLCYDRGHRRDEFGYLVGLRFSRKAKWRKFFPDAEIISADEFDAEWNTAFNSGRCLNRRGPTSPAR
jgi:hypothetical protein